MRLTAPPVQAQPVDLLLEVDAKGHKLRLNDVLPDQISHHSFSLFNHGRDPVAFKIKSTRPERYLIRPTLALVAPGRSTSCVLELQPLGRGVDRKQLRDHFLIQQQRLVVGPPGSPSQASSAASAVSGKDAGEPWLEVHPHQDPASLGPSELAGLWKQLEQLHSPKDGRFAYHECVLSCRIRLADGSSSSSSSSSAASASSSAQSPAGGRAPPSSASSPGSSGSSTSASTPVLNGMHHHQQQQRSPPSGVYLPQQLQQQQQSVKGYPHHPGEAGSPLSASPGNAYSQQQQQQQHYQPQQHSPPHMQQQRSPGHSPLHASPPPSSQPLQQQQSHRHRLSPQQQQQQLQQQQQQAKYYSQQHPDYQLPPPAPQARFQQQPQHHHSPQQLQQQQQSQQHLMHSPQHRQQPQPQPHSSAPLSPPGSRGAYVYDSPDPHRWSGPLGNNSNGGVSSGLSAQGFAELEARLMDKQRELDKCVNHAARLTTQLQVAEQQLKAKTGEADRLRLECLQLREQLPPLPAASGNGTDSELRSRRQPKSSAARSSSDEGGPPSPSSQPSPKSSGLRLVWWQVVVLLVLFVVIGRLTKA